ncbi:MAG: MFS transporter [Dehalococcoidia bacterium]|nr:MFS transporter [Dehalococcoidia bacterium]
MKTTRRRLIPDIKTFSALSEANYRLLWLSQASSSIGRSMRVFIRGYFVYQITNSTVWLGAVNASLAFPMLFLPFVGGVLADRMDRKKLLVITESALVLLWIVVSIAILAGLPKIEWVLVVSSLISGTVQSFGRPAHQVVIPNVVSKENLMNAIALDTTIQRGATVLAPTLGGLLLVIISPGAGFLVTAALQGVAVICLLLMKWSSEGPIQTRQSTFGSLLEGFHYMRKDMIILGVVAMGASSSLFAGAYGSFLPAFAKDTLHVGSQGLGLLLTAGGVGAVTGGLVMASIGGFKHKGALQLAAGMSYAVLLLMLAQSTSFSLSLVLMGLVSVMTVSFGTVNDTILQLIAPDQLRGRIMGVRLVIHGLAPFGLLPMGILAQAFGVPFAVTLGAALYATAIVLVALIIPQLRNYTWEDKPASSPVQT